MTVQHEDIADPYIHEPKGTGAASADTVYVADGAGSGTWQQIDVDQIDYAGSLQGQIQSDLDDMSLEVTGRYYIHVTLDAIDAAAFVLVPVLVDSTVIAARATLADTIATDDGEFNILNAAGAAMGTETAITAAASVKGTSFAWTATGNNEITAPSYFEVKTDGDASTGAVPLFITVELEAVLNQ